MSGAFDGRYIGKGSQDEGVEEAVGLLLLLLQGMQGWLDPWRKENLGERPLEELSLDVTFYPKNMRGQGCVIFFLPSLLVRHRWPQ